jgi:acyl-CoA synthetase (AMP-forming)/AMP-acid ligase II
MIFCSRWPNVAVPDVPYSEYIFARTHEWADRPAFIEGSTGRMLTHGQVHASARRVAAALARRGLRKGDRFAIVSPNLPEYAIAFHGIALAGGIVTTANPRYTDEELAFQLKDSGARFVLTSAAFLDCVCTAAEQSRIDEVFVFEDGSDATPFSALLDEAGPPPRLEIDSRTDLLALPYSSGTTGRAKGVMLTHRNLVAMQAMLGPSLPEEGSHQCMIGLLPFFHAYGLTMMNGTLRRGATCITLQRFDVEQYLTLIERHRVTTLNLVPPMVLAFARHPAVSRHDLSSLQFVGCGAAPLDASLQQEASEQLKVAIRQGYGLTEATIAVASWPVDARAPMRGCVGQLLPNVEARIVDPSSGDELGAGRRGELWVRGPNVMRGYLNQPEATAATLDSDGWLRTGDIASINDDGYLFIVDRLKELIKVQGYQVAPAHLEALLLQHPAVADAAVIGVPDDELGERPVGFVVLDAAFADVQEIIAFVANHVAPHERIREVRVVDAIPKSPSGKVLRRVLREQVSGRRLT